MTVSSSRTRWRIVSLLCAFSMMSYVLRMNISVAAKFMMSEFSLTQVQIGQIFSSFMLGYALFQLPLGMLGDRWGPRRTLALAGVTWGIASMLTAFVPGRFVVAGASVFVTLLVIRFLLGIGEAATYPVATLSIANWVSPRERGLSNAIVIAAASFGAILTPPLISWLMVTDGWRLSFYLTGSVAFVVSLLWWIMASDSPEHHALLRKSPAGRAQGRAAVAPESRIAHETGPTWKSVLAKRELWILSISYMLDSYVLFIFIFWLYTYLTDVRGFSLLRGGLFASLPFIASTVMTPIGGSLCDWCCARYGARRGRRIEPVVCLLSSGFLLFLGAKVSNPYIAIVVLSFTFGFVQSTEGAYWTTSNDIGPQHAGTSGGIMNMVGNLGGVFSTALVPILVQHFGWLIALSSGTVTALIAATLWFFVNVDRPLNRLEN